MTNSRLSGLTLSYQDLMCTKTTGHFTVRFNSLWTVPLCWQDSFQIVLIIRRSRPIYTYGHGRPHISLKKGQGEGFKLLAQDGKRGCWEKMKLLKVSLV